MRSILLGLLLMLNVANADTVVVSSYNEEKMTYEDVYQVFSLRQTMWKDGTKIVVVMLPERHPASLDFISNTFGISPQRFARLQKLVGTKSVARLIEVHTTQDAVEVISSKYGAIGYINVKEVNSNLFVIVIE